MNGSEAKYSSEYVEIQTSLEHIRTKLESIEQSIRDVHQFHLEMSKRVDQNRIDLAGVKATAAVFGGVAGSLFAVILRMIFSWKS